MSAMQLSHSTRGNTLKNVKKMFRGFTEAVTIIASVLFIAVADATGKVSKALSDMSPE